MKNLVFMLVFAAMAFFFVSSVHAQTSPQPLFTESPNKPLIQLPNLIGSGLDTPQKVFQFIIRTLALVGGIMAFLLILYGGYKYISSGGDPAAAEVGKKIIIGTVIGVLIIILSSVVVRFLIAIIRAAI
jgi:hypothetical protein